MGLPIHTETDKIYGQMDYVSRVIELDNEYERKVHTNGPTDRCLLQMAIK